MTVDALEKAGHEVVLFQPPNSKSAYQNDLPAAEDQHLRCSR